MRETAIALVLLATAACGRLGFDEQADGDADAGNPAFFVDPCPGTALDCAGTASCQDFESGNFDSWGYECDGNDFQCSPSVPEVTLEIVETPACNGQRVFRAFTTGGPDARENAYLGEYLDDDLADELYLRFAMRWPSGTNFLGRGIVLVPLSPSGSKGGPRLELGDKPGEMILDLDEVDHVFAAPTPTDEWTCVELHLSPTKSEVWVNGESGLVVDGPSLPAGTQMDIVALGITASSSAGPTELFFDDFALSTSRIGCVPGE